MLRTEAVEAGYEVGIRFENPYLDHIWREGVALCGVAPGPYVESSGEYSRLLCRNCARMWMARSERKAGDE